MPKRPGSPLEPPGASKLTKFFTVKESKSKVVKEDDAGPSTTTKTTTVKEVIVIDDANVESEQREVPDLSKLVAMEGITTPQEADARFEAIANALFNDYRLRIHRVQNGESPEGKKTKDTYLQIMEMEFYLIMPGVHEDPFCHGSVEQEQSGIWYFHRSPQMSHNSFASVGGAYRSGSRKGLDITLGAQLSAAASASATSTVIPHTRGGILFRSARNVHTQAIVSGPSLLVDSILKAAGADSIETLVSEHWGGDLSAFSPTADAEGENKPRISTLSLVPVSEVRPPPTMMSLGQQKKAPKVLRTVRIGLDLGHYSTKPTLEDPRVIFVQRPLRFLIEPNLLKVNGRAQTFLGLLQEAIGRSQDDAAGTSTISRASSLPLSKPEEARVIESIGRLGGFTASTARNYLSYYQRGVTDKPSIKNFCGTPGKGVCQSPEQLLKLLGALAVFGK